MGTTTSSPCATSTPCAASPSSSYSKYTFGTQQVRSRSRCALFLLQLDLLASVIAKSDIVEARRLLANGVNPDFLQLPAAVCVQLLASAARSEEMTALLLDYKLNTEVIQSSLKLVLHLRPQLAKAVAMCSPLGVIECLLLNGLDPLGRDADKLTPLHIITLNANNKYSLQYQMDVATLLLGYKASPNAATPEGHTPMHFAALRPERRELSKLLLEHKALPDSTTNKLHTPLHLAVQSPIARMVNFDGQISWCFDGDIESAVAECKMGDLLATVELLLQARADPDERDAKQETALHKAVRLPPVLAVPVAKTLLEHKASVTVYSSADYSPLALACMQTVHECNSNVDYLPVIDLLLHYGARPDVVVYRVPLLLHVIQGYVPAAVRCASLLLNYKANAQADDWNRTALHIAASRCSPELCHLLLQAKADIRRTTAIQSLTPLQCALSRPHPDRAATVRCLLEARADPHPNIFRPYEGTLLQDLVVEKPHTEDTSATILVMLDAKADPHLRRAQDNKTAFQLACEAGLPNAVCARLFIGGKLQRVEIIHDAIHHSPITARWLREHGFHTQRDQFGLLPSELAFVEHQFVSARELGLCSLDCAAAEFLRQHFHDLERWQQTLKKVRLPIAEGLQRTGEGKFVRRKFEPCELSAVSICGDFAVVRQHVVDTVETKVLLDDRKRSQVIEPIFCFAVIHLASGALLYETLDSRPTFFAADGDHGSFLSLQNAVIALPIARDGWFVASLRLLSPLHEWPNNIVKLALGYLLGALPARKNLHRQASPALLPAAIRNEDFVAFERLALINRCFAGAPSQFSKDMLAQAAAVRSQTMFRMLLRTVGPVNRIVSPFELLCMCARVDDIEMMQNLIAEHKGLPSNTFSAFAELAAQCSSVRTIRWLVNVTLQQGPIADYFSAFVGNPAETLFCEFKVISQDRGLLTHIPTQLPFLFNNHLHGQLFRDPLRHTSREVDLPLTNRSLPVAIVACHYPFCNWPAGLLRIVLRYAFYPSINEQGHGHYKLMQNQMVFAACFAGGHARLKDLEEAAMWTAMFSNVI